MRGKFFCALGLLTLLALAATSALAGGVDLIKQGNQLARAGQFEKAIQAFTKALRAGDLSPANRAVALNNRGSAKDDMGQTDWALLDYQEAIKTNPNYAEVYYNRSFAYERKGLLAKAFKDMEKALSLSPKDKDYENRLQYLRGKLLKATK